MNYPNLEQLETICKKLIQKDKELNLPKTYQSYFEPDLFVQTWPRMCMAFDIDENGEGIFSSDAEISSFVTIMKEKALNLYFVFINDDFCYKIKNPNEIFFEDLKNRHMETLGNSAIYNLN